MQVELGALKKIVTFIDILLHVTAPGQSDTHCDINNQ